MGNSQLSSSSGTPLLGEPTTSRSRVSELCLRAHRSVSKIQTLQHFLHNHSELSALDLHVRGLEEVVAVLSEKQAMIRRNKEQDDALMMLARIPFVEFRCRVLQFLAGTGDEILVRADHNQQRGGIGHGLGGGGGGSGSPVIPSPGDFQDGVVHSPNYNSCPSEERDRLSMSRGSGQGQQGQQLQHSINRTSRQSPVHPPSTNSYLRSSASPGVVWELLLHFPTVAEAIDKLFPLPANCACLHKIGSEIPLVHCLREKQISPLRFYHLVKHLGHHLLHGCCKPQLNKTRLENLVWLLRFGARIDVHCKEAANNLVKPTLVAYGRDPTPEGVKEGRFRFSRRGSAGAAAGAKSESAISGSSNWEKSLLSNKHLLKHFCNGELISSPERVLSSDEDILEAIQRGWKAMFTNAAPVPAVAPAATTATVTETTDDRNGMNNIQTVRSTTSLSFSSPSDHGASPSSPKLHFPARADGVAAADATSKEDSKCVSWRRASVGKFLESERHIDVKQVLGTGDEAAPSRKDSSDDLETQSATSSASGGGASSSSSSAPRAVPVPGDIKSSSTFILASTTATSLDPHEDNGSERTEQPGRRDEHEQG
mmetsp:Transcript_9620/g.23644  ORF Transcript_9620/g.23644 Transcript_9620/m.23644 type:complete len:597 (+) Transcript_9620:133-1923(+)